MKKILALFTVALISNLANLEAAHHSKSNCRCARNGRTERAIALKQAKKNTCRSHKHHHKGKSLIRLGIDPATGQVTVGPGFK